jgi:ATP-dependent Clp protease adapter protein ClpS
MSIRPPHRSNNRWVPPAYGEIRPQRADRLPPPRYKVLLHNTADKELMFVVRVVQELTRFGMAEAEFRMWEAHYHGRSLVLVTHLERAELYVEQFADRGLCATIEKA